MKVYDRQMENSLFPIIWTRKCFVHLYTSMLQLRVRFKIGATSVYRKANELFTDMLNVSN